MDRAWSFVSSYIISGAEDARLLERATSTTVSSRRPTLQNPSYSSCVTAGLPRRSAQRGEADNRAHSLSPFSWYPSYSSCVTAGLPRGCREDPHKVERLITGLSLSLSRSSSLQTGKYGNCMGMRRCLCGERGYVPTMQGGPRWSRVTKTKKKERGLFEVNAAPDARVKNH